VKSIDLFFKLRDYILLSTNLETRKYGFNGWQQQLIEGILDGF
jgi:hypothetical protein